MMTARQLEMQDATKQRNAMPIPYLEKFGIFTARNSVYKFQHSLLVVKLMSKVKKHSKIVAENGSIMLYRDYDTLVIGESGKKILQFLS